MDTSQQRPRILVVDESRSVRTRLIQLIRDQYDFREESDGQGGWQALVIDHSIQLVICALSISMPVLDSDGLLAQLRSSRLARLRQIPVLMIASRDEEANARARALGASDFIVSDIGASELLARIASALRLAEAQNELRENPERDAQHPDTGLPTRQRLEVQAAQAEVQAAQAISYALRHESPVSILIMSFDRYDALRNEHGEDLVKELHKRFAGMLANKIRKEDSLGHYSGNDLAVVSPGTPYPACEAFANRLREAFAVANIAVHGKRLDLSVSVGVANTPVDRLHSAASLLTLATQRLKTAQQAGGNRVVACGDTPLSQQPAPRLGHAIDLIKAGHESAVIPHLLHLSKEVLPFLELLERELKLGLPLADLRQRTRDREH
ncbi:MAG: Stalked cell differentiation-controlling protein [Candidatus Accumulibacter appositus]|uniref:diguanylate cyclase n=1 Tax=Candidatus Accumulibacter appositus TaxID=1454003 RepID=A0A011NB75_9PROT|nr:MAG: Stalked cell differentiation-controlling protein [Candidatus Accumulibacter appositus]